MDDHSVADRVVLRGRALSVGPALQEPEDHEEQAHRREHRAEPVIGGLVTSKLPATVATHRRATVNAIPSS